MMTDKIWKFEEIKTQVHWMCLQMGELTLDQLDMGREWVRWGDGEHYVPVAKQYLYKLFDLSEKYLRMRD